MTRRFCRFSRGLLRWAVFVLYAGVTVKAITSSSLCYPDYVGDGWCDEPFNIAECDYDGGDCCECTCVDGPLLCSSNSGDTCIDPACPDEMISGSDPSDDDVWNVFGDDDDEDDEDDEDDDFWNNLFGDDDSFPEEDQERDCEKNLYIGLGAGAAGVVVLFCAVGVCFFFARVKRLATSDHPAARKVQPEADSTGAAVPTSADLAPPPHDGDPPAYDATTAPQASDAATASQA